MRIQVQNHAEVSNKYVRFIKWRLHRINQKFAHKLLYADIYIGKEGGNDPSFNAVIKMGIKGHDLLISKKAKSVEQLWKRCSSIVERQVRKWKEKNQIKFKSLTTQN